MARYHINPEGKAGVCKASLPERCRFFDKKTGTLPPHFDNKADAEQYVLRQEAKKHRTVPESVTRKANAEQKNADEEQKRIKKENEQYTRDHNRLKRVERDAYRKEMDCIHDIDDLKKAVRLVSSKEATLVLKEATLVLEKELEEKKEELKKLKYQSQRAYRARVKHEKDNGEIVGRIHAEYLAKERAARLSSGSCGGGGRSRSC